MRDVKSLILPVLVTVTIIILAFLMIIILTQPTRFQANYLNILENCNDPTKKVLIRTWFLQGLNFTEIYDWVHANIEFVPFTEHFPADERHSDPIEIKEYGRGRCGEFSILYVAVCIAHGYEARLVVAVDVGGLFWSEQHAWAEVKVNGLWMHVDPSERRWNDPQMYKNWKWGEAIGSGVKIFAFEDKKVEEVTQNYA